MISLTKSIAALAFAITALSTSAFADTYQHIDQLALRIEQQSKLIVSECRHYRHTPEYRHLVEDAREICRLADHLHDVAHHHGDLAHMESDLQQLDVKFHHLESVFDRVELNAARGYGHVHGETSHVKQLLNSIEDNIHHLQDDLRSLRGPICSVEPITLPRAPLYRTPYSSHWGGYHSQPYGGIDAYGHGHDGHLDYPQPSRSRGITIGGGSSRFTIRF